MFAGEHGSRDRASGDPSGRTEGEPDLDVEHEARVDALGEPASQLVARHRVDHDSLAADGAEAR